MSDDDFSAWEASLNNYDEQPMSTILSMYPGALDILMAS